MKTLILILVVLTMVLPSSVLAGGKCTGSDPCYACTNCSNCKHCKSGGKCGTCKTSSKKVPKATEEVNTTPAVKITPTTTTSALTGQHCGTWRWDCKTLSDPKAKLILSKPPVKFTFDDLLKTDTVILPQGGYPIVPRKVDEFMVTVSGKILKYKLEDDNDYHVVLTDGRYFIVCEIPSPSCDGAVQSGLSAEYVAARKVIESLPGKKEKGWFEVAQDGSTFTFTGSLLHDFKHGARFSMPNCLEIHPVTNIIKNK